MTTNGEMLSGIIFTAMTTKYADNTPSLEEYENEANQIRVAFQVMYPITDEEFVSIQRRVRESILVTIGMPHSLKGIDTTHQSWYLLHKNDGFYWNRYKKYLETKKKWSPDVIRRLNDTTNSIMDDLGDPTQKNKMFNRRGLLLGDVQSGKTATYTAICNKAADSGYRVIIVLAGMLENLRFQTQERLDAEFAGRESKYALDTKADQIVKNRAVGVGRIGPFDLNKRIACFTSVSTDFSKNVLKSNDLTLRNLKGTALFVVKKNKSVLNNLHKWLVENNSDDDGKIDLSLLLIDDEADNASVNTQSEEKDPTAINIAIRNILASFYQTTYLGITATPFANIFINPETPDGQPDDLFPRHFLTVLPTPSHYIGADSIFGCGNEGNWRIRNNAPYSKILIKIQDDEAGAYFPFKHKKELASEITSLPKSLYDALGYFILASAIRDVRGDDTEHASMMINVSRFTDVQNVITELINVWLSGIKRDVEDFGRLAEKDALKIESIKSLYDLWEVYEFSRLCQCDWVTLQQEFLYEAVKRIETRAVNQSTGAASLNYFAYKNVGLRVIAVGGNSLSRGLTLEGLCVSYFYRNTMMYDTLLQMGRWFGYRPNYDDLVKIWMAEDAVDWYGYITDAVNELKEELKTMERQNQTPEDFGLKVRQDPSSLIVTARNKMRLGTTITVPISVSGRLIETPRLKNDIETIRSNELLCRDFIAKLDDIAEIRGCEIGSPRAMLWKNVDKKHIERLVREFSTHPWNLNFQPLALADYINESEVLDLWDVAIPYGGADSYIIETTRGSISICPEPRRIDEDESAHMFRVSGTHLRVGTGLSTRIGLDSNEVEAIKLSVIERNRERHGRDKEKITDRTFLTENRKPILMIHVLKVQMNEEKKEKSKCPDHLFALGLGFPKIGSDKLANYVVNVNELKNWIDVNEFEDDNNDI